MSKIRKNGVWLDELAVRKRVHEAWVDAVKDYYVRTPNISGVPPFAFKSDGENLRDWSMSGQTVQASTPTPANPVDVSGVGERTGNLFNVSDYSVGGTSFITKRITLEPNTAYTMSSNCPLYNVGALIAIGNVGESFTTANNGVYPNHPITRTTDTNGELVIGLRTNGSDYSPADYETMLNTGSTALPFEPYGVKIPITCGGQTTNIYLGSASTTRRVKKLALTGTENWQRQSNSHTTCINLYTAISSAQPSGMIMSNVATYNSSAGGGNDSIVNVGRINNTGANLLMDMDLSDFATTTEWKTYLQQQYANGTPVTIYYVLATPETAAVNEPLMKIGTYVDEITKTGTGVNIPTVSGSNTLAVNTTVQPSGMTIQSISQWV